MTIHVQSTATSWAQAAAHLRGAPERVVFFAAEALGDVAVVSELLVIDDSDLELGPWCVQLRDDAQQRVFRWAAEREGWLIEAHSHLGPYGDPAVFSPTDTSGLKEWVPHVRWRLRQRPYAAFVFGPETVDGIAWAGPRGAVPETIGSWRVEGAPVTMTGLSTSQFKEG